MRAFYVLTWMELRRLLRTRWVIPALFVTPMVILPLTLFTAISLGGSSPKRIAIPSHLPEDFLLAEAMIRYDLEAIPSDDPAALVAEGTVDGAILSVQHGSGGAWEATLLGVGSEVVDGPLQRAGDAALARELTALGVESGVMDVPRVSGDDAPGRGLMDALAKIPRGWIAAFVAFSPISILFYVLIPMATTDRLSGLYESLGVLALPPWLAVAARWMALLLMANFGSLVYVCAIITPFHSAVPGLMPSLSDAFRVWMAQGFMLASFLWAGERARTTVAAFQIAGMMLYGQFALMGTALIGRYVWVPLGGILVAEAGSDFVLACCSTLGGIAFLIGLIAHTRASIESNP